MTTKEIQITDKKFSYLSKTYDCSLAIERDTDLILKEAETSHKEIFDKSYKRETLQADKIRVFFDKDDTPIFAMILYLIFNKAGNYKRMACGDYYRIYENLVFPHPYQCSICW